DNIHNDTSEHREKMFTEKVKYQNFLKLASDGLFIMDPYTGDLLEYSQMVQTHLGYSDAEMKHLNVMDWDKGFASIEEYRAMIDGLGYTPVRFERVHTRKDGSSYHAAISAVKIRFDDEEFVYASVRDITEERRMRQELIDAKRMAESLLNEQKSLLSLFDKGDSVLFKWKNDARWSIDYVSDNVCKLLGYAKNDFLKGRVVYASCIHKADLPQVIDEVRTAVKKGLDYFVHEPYRIVTEHGEIKWVLDYTVTQKDARGQITHFIGYLNDITALKQYEKELLEATRSAEEANRSKSAFLANMSHEIRTPMHAILGFVEQLAKGEKDPDRQKQFAVINSAGQTLLNIINDILDLSKIESGKMDIESHPYPLRELCTEAAELFAPQIQDKHIDYNLEIEPGLPDCIRTDALRLKQIVFNLLSNAIKFTPEYGSITLNTGCDQQRLRISVTDTGVGIAPDKLEKIFDAFDQEDVSTTRKFGGTGLGLTIASRLVKMMGGELRVESRLGKGSRFYFDIPVHVCDEKTAETDTGDAATAADHPLLNVHLLVAEDNPTNQMLMRIILEEAGVTYDMANDGVEAISMYKTNRYDAVVMDENMPNMNGIEAAKHIRIIEADNHLPHIPIIAVTANALPEDRQRFLDAGMDDYISKPYSEKDIIDTLHRHLNGAEGHIASETPQEPAPSAGRLLDMEEIRASLLYPDELLHRLLRTFRDTAGESVAALEEAVEHDDLPAIGQAAHSIKGAAGILRIEPLQSLAEEIEHASKRGEAMDYAAACKKLKAMVQTVKQEIDAELT
ncbi:MAG: ATP-binding protein, partial [Campylobacterales bacterium]